MRKRVLIYVRVSTKKQTNLNQFMALRKAAHYYDWDIVGVYRDWGMTGKHTKRPGYQRLVEDIHRRKIDMVAVWSLSRIGRSLKDLLMFTDDVLRPNNVNLYSQTENLDTSSPSGRMFFSIMGAIAQYERESTVEKVMEGLTRAKSQGKILGRPAVDDPKSKRYNPELVEHILQLIKTDLTIKQIAKQVGCGVGTVYKILENTAPSELSKRKRKKASNE